MTCGHVQKQVAAALRNGAQEEEDVLQQRTCLWGVYSYSIQAGKAAQTAGRLQQLDPRTKARATVARTATAIGNDRP